MAMTETEDGLLLFLDDDEYTGLTNIRASVERSASSCRNKTDCIEHRYQWSRVTTPHVDSSSKTASDPVESNKSSEGDQGGSKEEGTMEEDEDYPAGERSSRRGRMDSAASMASLASMDQGQLAEQLALVQEMVQEMKQTFTGAMEELAKTQYGDTESRNQQQLTDVVQSLKCEVESLKISVKEISDNQKVLEERLKQQAVRSESIHQATSPGREMAPMMRPYLASLNQQKSSSEDTDGDLVTALACKSLNLSQALHEKCLHLEASASSEEEEHMRGVQPPFSVMETDTSMQREKAAQEIVEAERSFCSQLWNIIDGYMSPLRELGVMSIRDANSLFPAYIPQIYENHCLQLKRMEERLIKWKYSGMLGDIFIKMTDSVEGDGLALYKDYINDFSSIINNMNKWFSQSAAFREFMGSTNLASSSVIPLLLAPLQQIPKYSLLIKDLVKYTGTDHPDRYYLESVLSRLKNFLNVMNEELEQAMQYLNVARPSYNRSRECGNSTHSDSSGDANNISSARDSGVHSSGDDPPHRIQASPNTARRYVLQVLREKRERRGMGSHHQNYTARPLSVPPRSHILDYGSHPDLTNQEFTEYVEPPSQGDMFLPYQSGNKMYSSLTKIAGKSTPELRSPEKPPRRIRIRRRQDNPAPQQTFNTNYLRPLTPHFPFHSSPMRAGTMNMENQGVTARGRGRYRPSSSIDFTGQQLDRDKLFEQRTYLESPRGHPGEGRARNELHLSLQKLMSERDRQKYDHGPSASQRLGNGFMPVTSVMGRQEREGQYMQTIQRDEEEEEMNELSQDFQENQNFFQTSLDHAFQKNAIEDYGVYGDDDEDNGYREESHDQGHMTTNFANETHGDSKDMQSDPFSVKQLHSVVDHSRQRSFQTLFNSDTGYESKSNVSKDIANPQPKVEEDRRSMKDIENLNKPENLVPLRSNKAERRRLPSNIEAQQSMQRKEAEKEENKRHSYVQAEKPSEDAIAGEKLPEAPQDDYERKSGSWNPSQPVSDSISKPNTESNIPSLQNRNSISLPTRDDGDVSNVKTAKKLPVVKGRYSQPNLEQIYAASKIPSPPVSPTEKRDIKLSAKDTKIPMYSPRKVEKGAKADPMSKSTEDMSKNKKRTTFGSIKNFFGRKRKIFRQKGRSASCTFDITAGIHDDTREVTSDSEVIGQEND
ncbi:hypothetical protein FSP39_009296 [Pinctada imbricata]|uniref:DH domain-containing protein n=1 Tax=Pinctada imbricata TaxID=66713 RepID=A0AA89BZ30_PINIB|nr:hypothetical protein FSP39_009296 [Pinctada imbricata]